MREPALARRQATTGVWAIFHGVNEIFAAFAVREAGRRTEHLVG